MNREVKVFVKGIHIHSESEIGYENRDEILTETTGIYHHKDGRHYVRYEQIYEHGAQTSNNMLKIDGNKIELIKKGYGATHLYFSEGDVNYTYYQTVAGKLFVGVNTKRIVVEESNSNIVVRIEYELIMEEEKISDSSIDIEIVFA